MPNPIDSLFAEALAPYTQPTPLSPVELKEQNLIEASAVKQLDFTRVREARATGKGSRGVGELQWDMQNLHPAQVQQKYGPEVAQELMQGLAGTREQTEADYQALDARDENDVAFDTVTGIGSGFVGSLGGLGALGIGLVDDEAGVWAAEKVQKGMEAVESIQSDGLNAARRQSRLATSLDTSDNAAQMREEDAAGANEFVSGLRRWGRDTVDTISNAATDPTMFVQGTSEAIGSLLAGGPISKGLKTIGNAAMTGAKVRGAAGIGLMNQAAQRAANAGNWAAWPAAIGGMEAGGAFSGTVSDIMSMPLDQLQETSEPFRELVDQGMAPEDARIEIANSAGKQAAAAQGAVGFATGGLSRFAETPFKVPSVRGAAANVFVKEPLEESIQGGTGALSQNKAVQDFADPDRALTEGAGEGTALGALYGIGAAGAVQGPGMVRKAPAAALKAGYHATAAIGSKLIAAGTPAARALVERGRKNIEQAEKASPVADSVISDLGAQAAAVAPQAAADITAAVEAMDATPEQKAAATGHVQALNEALQFDPVTELEGLNSELAEAVSGATNRVEAIQNMAYLVEKLPEGPDQFAASVALWGLMDKVTALQESDPEILRTIREDPNQNAALVQLETVVANIESPIVKRALRTLNEIVSKAQAEANIQPVSEESLATPEGQQNVKNAIAVASLYPDKGNLDANEQILTHTANGKLNLSPAQLNALRTSRTLLRARAKLEAEIEANGLKDAKDVVSSQIVASNDPLRKIAKSALQHTESVLSAMRGNNLEKATGDLEDFGFFVKHMQNKLEAINTHFNNGNPNAPSVGYSALQPTIERDWKPSTKGEYVNTASPKSFDHAQSVALETSILTDVYNGLVEAFPELNLPKIEQMSLAPELVGKPDELVRKFAKPKVAPAPEVVKESSTPAATQQGVIPSTDTEEVPVAVVAPVVEDVAASPVEGSAERETDVEPTVAEGSNDPVISNKEWMTGKVQDIRPDNGRARFKVGDTTISYDLFNGRVIINLISTPESARGKGSARKAMDAFLALTDAAELTTELTVAEQSEGTNQEGLLKFYNSLGFNGEGEKLVREVGAEAVVARPVEATEVVSQEQAPVGDKLYEGDKNMFNEAFNEPKEEKTNIQNDPTPRATVAKVLSSALRFKGANLKTRNELTPEIIAAYKRLLDGPKAVINVLLDGVNSNLQSFLNRPYSKTDSRTMGEIFAGDLEVTKKNGDILSGGEMNRFTNGKVLNLVEAVENGFDYNQSLLEKAALAAVQWVLTAKNYESIMDANDVADIVGAPFVDEQLINDLSEGLSTDQAIRSLGQKIAQYWGMDSNKTTDDAYVEGIPQSLAAEMLRALEQMGLLEIKTVNITSEQLTAMGAKDVTPKTPKRFIVKEVNEDSPLHEFTDAIEVVVMKEPEHTNYFGDEVPAVAERQMNNPEVANTADQKDAIQKEQQTPFYIVPMMKTFFDNMGMNNLLSLFGDPEATEEIDGKPNPDYNINHLKSMVGKNRSISAAFLHMQNVAADLNNTALALGKDVTDVAIRYAYNMSRVGRMQMLGKYNPQASKLMREVFSATRSILDLSGANLDHWNAYSLGLAQAFGIKIHNLSLAESQEKLAAMLNGPFDNAILMLREWMANPGEFSSNQVETLREGFGDAGADLTMVGLHALLDYVRFSESEDQTNFTTSMYVEADGVTNGPINAMALMTIGGFNETWANNIEKGGLSLGPAKSMAEIREGNTQDLYQASTDATRVRLAELRDQLGRQESGSNEALEMMDHLLSIMTLFNKDIIFDPDKAWDEGGLEMKRGIAKNPLTITIYGSGARGISNKLISAITDGIYAQFTAAIQAQKLDPEMSFAEAMFPNAIDPEVNLKALQTSLDTLTAYKTKRVKGELTFEQNGSNRNTFDPKTFTFNKVEMENLHENMLKLFVEPMRQGIEDTVGERLFKAVGLVRDATQVQSLIYQYEYMKQLEQLMEDKAENDPNWRQGDFVSRADREKIAKGLTKVAPLIKTGEQTFLVSSNEKMEIAGTDVVVGSALDGTMRTGPSAYAPGSAGVRGIPMLTIGMGDGMMMQILAKLGLAGTLKIFDGMNMPLDKIREYSLLANEAVLESWKANPLREVAKSFDVFLKNYNPESINEVTRDALILTLFDVSERFDKKLTITDDMIKDRLAALQENLEWSARSIDARNAALETVPVSVDQMASVAAPATNGVPTAPSDTPENLLACLNKKYQELMEASEPEEASTPEIAPVVVSAPAESTPEVDKVGRLHSTGVRVLSWTAMTKLTAAMSEAQKLIYGEIRRSMAAKDYTVVAGTVEQLDAYIEAKGLKARPQQETFGWINIGDKTIYMVNPTMETMTHELVHASSYEKVLAHYEGNSTPEVAEAIQRLEEMMKAFLGIDTRRLSGQLLTSYNSAREAILSSNLEPDSAVAQAKALNEFMAWNLTNQSLTNAMEKSSVPRLAQLTKDAIKWIRQLIWGKKKMPKPVDDFLSNLQFNSGIIIRSQPTLSQIVREGELFHAPAYGTSDRLSEVRQSFGLKIADYLSDEKFSRKDKLRQVKVSSAQMVAVDVALSMNAHGFPMSMQESAAFRMIVTALATEAEIDPTALSRVQELYAYVSKKLTVEDFMADPESLDPAARYYAQEKYDSIMGKNLTRMDEQGRFSLLPAFLGLATVSDEFRAVLAKLEVPKKIKNADGTLDAVLENTANHIMDSLSQRLAGDVSSKNVQEAVDNLIQHINKVAQDEQSFIDQYAAKVGGVTDRLNTYVVEGMEKLSDIVMEKASDLEKDSQNKLVTGLARMTQLLASVVSEKNGAIVAEQTMVMLNKSTLWEPLQKMMADLVGRTQSNKLVYDMIKVTRSMVQQVRQQFREETPRIIMSKFKKKLTPKQDAAMFHGLAKTDAALLRDTMTHAEIQNLYSDKAALDSEIDKLEQTIQANDPRHYGLIKLKAKQLANFMNTGVPGKILLRNAYSIANLFQHTKNKGYKIPPARVIPAIDKLVTLYAIESLSQSDRDAMASLAQSEAEGLSFTLDYLVGQRKEEMSKVAKGKARINAYKGFIPTEQEQGVSLIVADDSKFSELRQKGYVRIADYKGSSLESRLSKRGYYYSPLSGRAMFNQGIMQNVRHTAGGVDTATGFTVSQMAGRITDRNQVRRLAAQMSNETSVDEALMPVINDYGNVVALERPMSAVQWQRVQPSQNLPRMIGVWRGRQAEEGMSQIYNEKLIDGLQSMYEEDMKASSSNQKQYVNLLNPRSLNEVQQDAVNLFTDQTLEYIREKFGEEFWVRKDMLDDAVGYRSASVGDFWTGNTKWSKETQDTVKNLVAAFSIDGYKYLVKSEQVIQNLMSDARTLIVVKSVVVPVLNFLSNVYYLMSIGTPLLSIVRTMPKKLTEIDSYAKSRLRQIDAEAELRATENPIEMRKLNAEIQSITDSHKRLSIWPLIEAGEFSTIADVGMTSEDLELSSGKLVQYMEKMVNKLPEKVRNAGRYALITRDTALFQGLQKSVQYGDFIAKAVLYDDLTKRQKKSKEYAMGRVTEEFVNYDRLPGRFRSYLENMGLLWFYNYKIRITKVAVSMMRNNPVHALLNSLVPIPIDGIDSVMEDNVISKAIDGSLGYSMGPGMAIRAPTLNPWWNLIN